MKILSATPYFHYKIDNWETKKLHLQQAIDRSAPEGKRSSLQHFNSSRTDEEKHEYLVSKVYEILNDELIKLGSELGLGSIEITDAWAVRYDKGDFHDVHNHASTGLSAIVYIDYEQGHPSTTYVLENNIITDKTQLISPEVEEGDLVIVPSKVLHYTRPNEIDKPKVILAFDMQVEKRELS